MEIEHGSLMARHEELWMLDWDMIDLSSFDIELELWIKLWNLLEHIILGEFPIWLGKVCKRDFYLRAIINRLIHDV